MDSVSPWRSKEERSFATPRERDPDLLSRSQPTTPYTVAASSVDAAASRTSLNTPPERGIALTKTKRMPLADQASRHPRSCVMCAFLLSQFYHRRRDETRSRRRMSSYGQILSES